MIEINVNKTISLDIDFDLEEFIKNILQLKKIESGEFSFTFVNNERIVEINKQYLNKTHITDIISFNLADPEEAIIGDVYINAEQAALNANDYKISLEEEIKLLIVHGILHLLDYEDYTEEARNHMFAEQDRLLKLVNKC